VLAPRGADEDGGGRHLGARTEGLLHARGAAAARKAGGEDEAEDDGDYELRERRFGYVEVGGGKTTIRTGDVQMTKPIQARVPKSDWLQLTHRSDRAYEEDARRNVLGVVLGVAVGARGAREGEGEEGPWRVLRSGARQRTARPRGLDQGRTEQESQSHATVVCGRADGTDGWQRQGDGEGRGR
jgi:hypothetical protein